MIMPFSYLEKQKDFNIISNTTFKFADNSSQTVPERIFSCGVEWVVDIVWGDVAFSDHTYRYSSVSTDNIYFDEKITIMTITSDLLRFKASEQYVLWHGLPIFYQSTYNEMFDVDLSLFEQDLLDANSKEDCIYKIKEILKK